MYFFRLRDIREDKDLRQSDVAELLKISTQQYQLYESGKRTIPIDLMIALAKHYNVSLDYLTGITHTPTPLNGSLSYMLDLKSEDLAFAKKVKKAYEETYAK